MDSKRLIWLGMAMGSILGGLIPSLWDAGMFSLSSVIFSAIGGTVGIYVGFKLTEHF